jgi:hypothetical protein
MAREKFQTEQSKLSQTVGTMLSSLTKLSNEIITMHKSMTQMGTTFRKELSDLKWILLAQNGTKIASPRRKRATRSSSKEESSVADDITFKVRSGNDGKEKVKPSNNAKIIKDSTLWGSMCDTDMEGCTTMDEGNSTAPGGNSMQRMLNPPPPPLGNSEVGDE